MRFFKLAIVSALALGLTAPAFAQSAATKNAIGGPAVTTKAGTDVTPAKTEMKSTTSANTNTKSGTKLVRTSATKSPKTSSLHKASHKKAGHKKSIGPSTSKS